MRLQYLNYQKDFKILNYRGKIIFNPKFPNNNEESVKYKKLKNMDGSQRQA